MSRQRVNRVLGALLAGTLIGTAALQAQTGPGIDGDHPDAAPELFVPAEGGSYAEPGAETYVTRSRAVRINGEVLEALEALKLDRVTFNLFEDVRFVGVVERVGAPRDGTLSWSGPLDSTELGGFTMVARDGVMAARIWTASGGVCEVLYTDGVHWVREVDPAQVEPCDADDMEIVPEEEFEVDEGHGRDGLDLYGGGANCDGTAEIDVMFLYTPAAVEQVGDVVVIELRVDLGVTNANTAYWNSGINARVRAVHIAEVDYVESGSWSEDLSRLAYRNDGFMDEIHPLRDAVGADAVTLILTGGCGKAYLMSNLSATFQRWAFSLVGPGCLMTLTFAHELGHNLGCHHDHGHAGNGMYPYSMGHHFTGESSTLYRTVMAYAPGTRVPHFSNPNVLYDGVSTGVPAGDPNEADAALTINTSAKIVAQFRVRPDDCNGNCTPDEDDIADGTSADVDSSGVPDECEAPVLFVKQDATGENHGTSWDHAYTDLQDALAVASNPLNMAAEVWVAAGGYEPDRESGDRLASFLLPHGIAVYGGFTGTESSLDERNPDPTTNATILSGNIGGGGNDDDNTYHVAWAVSAPGTSRLDGFTLTDGNADFVAVPYCSGGGLDLLRSSATLANCRFEHNDAFSSGGGMHVSHGDDVVLVECDFVYNEAYEDHGGAVHLDDSNTVLSCCDFVDNYGQQGGARAATGESCTLTVKDSAFLENDSAAFQGGGGAVLLRDATDAEAVFMNCLFAASEADGLGGGISVDGFDLAVIGCDFLYNRVSGDGGAVAFSGTGMTPLFVDCLFALQQCSGHGAGLYVDGAAARVINCTFLGNSSHDGGGGIAHYGPVPSEPMEISNCVLWDNWSGTSAGSALWLDTSASVSVSYSDIEGGQSEVHVEDGCTLEWGDGNIDADPLFVDPDGPDDNPNTWEDNDYRLSPGSPCIDAGDNTAVPLDTLDLDGDGDTDERTPFDLDGNPRFVQDPLTEDTGVPDPPLYRFIVDMGAYEYQFCFGDLDEDDDVDIADLAQLLASYGETAGMTYHDGDLDGDGDVDLADLAELLGTYGTTCN